MIVEYSANWMPTNIVMSSLVFFCHSASCEQWLARCSSFMFSFVHMPRIRTQFLRLVLSSKTEAFCGLYKVINFDYKQAMFLDFQSLSCQLLPVRLLLPSSLVKHCWGCVNIHDHQIWSAKLKTWIKLAYCWIRYHYNST